MRSYGRWSGLKSTKKYNSDSALRSHIIVEHWILWAGKMTRQYYCQTPQMYLLQAHYYIASKHITASSLPTQAQRTVHCGIGQTATSVTCSYCDSEKETPEDLHTSCLAWTEACEHLFGRPTEITISYGKWQNLTPHRIKTPSLVDMKLWIYDYVWEICSQIKFCKNLCNRGL